MTEERIVEAALKLAGDAHLEDVSMRALANELQVPVMTIYNYVSSREALYELVVNHVLRPVKIPSPEAGSWDERMRQLQRDARWAMRKHPGVAFSRYGGGASEAVRLADGVLTILSDGGFSPDGAALAFATLYTFMLGQIEADAIADTMGGRAEATLDGVTGSKSLSAEEVFEFGFDAVIEGLKAKLVTKRSPRRTDRGHADSKTPRPLRHR